LKVDRSGLVLRERTSKRIFEKKENPPQDPGGAKGNGECKRHRKPLRNGSAKGNTSSQEEKTFTCSFWE